MSDETAVPAPVRLVRDFVNTYEPQVDEESLTTSDELAQWFTERGLLRPGERLQPADLTTAITVRKGLRAVLLGHAGHAADPDALQRLDAALTAAPVRLSLAAGGPRLVSTGGSPLSRALAALAEAIRQSAEDQVWTRLKACDRETCRWAYYDASRNRSRRWCSMAGCGNYVKMRRRTSSARL